MTRKPLAAFVLLVAACSGFAVATTVTAGSATAASSACTPDPSWPAARADLAAQVLSLINSHRASIGLAPLATSPSLTASAQWKAQHMAEYQYMAHDDPAPPIARAWYQRIQACGYLWGAGENIARWYPTPSSVVAAWLSDAPHKANIEGPWAATGIGVAVSSAGIPYWVEDFGAVLDSSSPPPPATSTAATTTRPATTTAPAPPTTAPTTTRPAPPPTTTQHTTTQQQTTAQQQTSSQQQQQQPTTPQQAPSAPAAATPSSATKASTAKTAVCVVPTVFRMRLERARLRLERAGCRTHVVDVHAKRIAHGRVAWQSPRGRVHMPLASVVTLAVSR
ncbi:MAG TPA: CAP domain-containing protein [Gaiellaceae bacterium]|nr:CAP domain-containing protein [Gaiellaceae bacterium]